ncbi:MAG: PKD domain-containing protein [bacterium]|nr:PKD domain-containing protein [bacterium]
MYKTKNGIIPKKNFMRLLSFVILMLSLSPAGCGQGMNILFDPKDIGKPVDPETVQIPCEVSRTLGVAPLSVHFNTELASGDFHNLDYTWDFGDPGSGNWGTTGKSKNTAKGAVAAHIFESPGTYTGSLTVRDGTTTVGVGSFTIEVEDPNTVYSGTNTICVNTACDSDFTGAPGGARTIRTNDLSSITSYAAAGSRILFKRGSSWTVSSDLSWPHNAGPVTMGAYGTGTNPDALGNYDNAPLITVTGGSRFCDINNKQNWRIVDLHFVDSTRTGTVVSGASNMQRFLFQRLKIEGFKTALGWWHYNEGDLLAIDQMVVSDCNLKNSEGGLFYGCAERIALLGSIFQNSMTSYVVSVGQAYHGIICHNIMSGSSLNTYGGQAFRLVGSGELGIPENGTGYLEKGTEFVVISNNVLGSSGFWPVTIGSEGSEDSRISNVIFQGNRILADYGSQNTEPVRLGLYLWARYTTIRNNIINGTGGANHFTGIIVEERGGKQPQGNRIYNNTIYRQDEPGVTDQQVAIQIGSTATGTVVMNNLARFPEIDKNKIISNSSADLAESNNLLTNTPGFVDPHNPTPLLRDFNIQSGSPAIGAGSEVPVFEDFDGSVRSDARYDLGALYYTGP